MVGLRVFFFLLLTVKEFGCVLKPNTPGKILVWFRNETTLLMLWQPPFPPGVFTHYKVSIEPPDARESELYVEKEGEPPGPAQAAFKGLVPGRAYNISVQTAIESEFSAPITAQYRTVPLRPRNVTASLADLKETSFRVTWLPPLNESEFEKYQVSVRGLGGVSSSLAPVDRARSDTSACSFDSLEPGANYTVAVKTLSGKVTSWPASTVLTLKPLPVMFVSWRYVEGAVVVWWVPSPGSTQDEYKVSYDETGSSHDGGSALMTSETSVALKTLQPGRNYTVTVCAVSRGVESNESVTSVLTQPLTPDVLSAAPDERALLLTWRPDVSSRQDSYELHYRRRGLPSAEFLQLVTSDTSATLKKLYPGAVYQIQLAAISYGVRSERRTLFKPVRPLPASWLRVDHATSNSVYVAWAGPARSTLELGGFTLRYRTLDDAHWHALDPLPPDASTAEITNMTHGEHYIIKLDTVSEDAAGETVESDRPLLKEHTVRPNPVTKVEQLLNTRNMTLQWPRPGGRVEWYLLRWWPLEEGEASGERNVTAPRASRTVRATLYGLKPGCNYTFIITTHSYNLTSDIFKTYIRMHDTAEMSDYSTYYIISSSVAGVGLLIMLVIIINKKILHKRKHAEETPGTQTNANPFYLNLLFRRECAQEIYARERNNQEVNHYEEVDHYEEIN